MYVKTDRDELQSIKLPEMDEIAQFSANNIAQVTQDDGEALVEQVDHITEHKTNNE